MTGLNHTSGIFDSVSVKAVQFSIPILLKYPSAANHFRYPVGANVGMIISYWFANMFI